MSQLTIRALEDYFVSEPAPLLTAQTIQVVMVRQLMDFTILRTEESRELNIVELPKNLSDPTPEVYGLFLASKQKAPESRHFAEYLRQHQEKYECFLPMDLCMECPRCVLFGAVKPKGAQYNIKHRVEYSSAFSLAPFRHISETLTFNAINEQDQLTHQALNVSHNYKPLSIFPSIVTLRAVTVDEFALLVKTLLACHSYGAESRVKGDARNEIIGIVGGTEEIITPLELNLELRSVLDGEKPVNSNAIIEKTAGILQKYKALAGTPGEVKIISRPEFVSVLNAIQEANIKELVTRLGVGASKFTEKARATA